MKCSSCASPLPAKSNICRYCGTVNDTDLRQVSRFTKSQPLSNRYCPECNLQLHTIDLKIDGTFYIERCEECLGIFLDSGELEALVEHAVAHVYDVDFKKMDTLIHEEGILPAQPVRYIKCPSCENMMNRRSAGSRSGIVIDDCKDCGVWLEGGELGRILKWIKAGGQLHHQERIRQAELQEARRKEKETGFKSMFAGDDETEEGFLVDLMYHLATNGK